MSDTVSVNDSKRAPKPARQLLFVAWTSVLVGLALQLVGMAVEHVGSLGEFAVELSQKVAWATLVCIGIAIGSAAASRARATLMGLAALLAAPIAFAIAKVVHKSLGQALSLSGIADDQPTSLVVALTVLKAIEYGLFAYSLGRLSRPPEVTLAPFVRRGAIFGALFGAAIVGATIALSPAVPPAAKLVGVGLNELLFPIGCAVVIYFAELFGSKA